MISRSNQIIGLYRQGDGLWGPQPPPREILSQFNSCFLPWRNIKITKFRRFVDASRRTSNYRRVGCSTRGVALRTSRRFSRHSRSRQGILSPRAGTGPYRERSITPASVSSDVNEPVCMHTTTNTRRRSRTAAVSLYLLVESFVRP